MPTAPNSACSAAPPAHPSHVEQASPIGVEPRKDCPPPLPRFRRVPRRTAVLQCQHVLRSLPRRQGARQDPVREPIEGCFTAAAYAIGHEVGGSTRDQIACTPPSPCCSAFSKPRMADGA